MLNLFDIDDYGSFVYLLDEMGRNVALNEAATPVKALITNTKLEQLYDDRRISTLEPLQRGDTVEWNDNVYMVISEINDKRYGHYKANMRLLPHQIMINKDCNMQNVPCYIESGNPALKHGQVMTLLDDRITVNVPSFKLNSKNASSAVFLIHGNKFKVISIDDYSQSGISILTCERDQIDPSKDDVLNDNAGGLVCSLEPEPEETEKPINEKRIEISSTATAEGDYRFIYLGQTKVITATVFEGDEKTGEAVRFKFYADDKISAPDTRLYTATVDDNVLTIKANSSSRLGYFWIRVILAGDDTIDVWQQVRVKGFL